MQVLCVADDITDVNICMKTSHTYTNIVNLTTATEKVANVFSSS